MIPQNCTFCGLCCTLTVRLSDNEIRRIEKGSSRKREEFVVADSDGKPLLKRENGWCTFFKREGKVGMCTIYDSRPDNCRDFPGKRLCDLAENPIYGNLTINPENKRIKLLLKNAPTAATKTEKVEEAKTKAERTFTKLS
ncbi:YkgJ family cysteine cluster protein [Candidatus Woesearchaeota archaeon]|nr:YkgJ family cysteine cluster protein [Candidatus Woesearchaeota archaeon]